MKTTRPRVGSRYVYRPAAYDRFDPCTTLAPGEPVRIVRPMGCPAPGTMGHAHVADMSGRFRGLVCVASLTRA